MWAVTAGGPAGSTAGADRSTALWVSLNEDLWTYSCFSRFVYSLGLCLFYSVILQTTSRPFCPCTGNQPLSPSLSLSAAYSLQLFSLSASLFFFLETFMVPYQPQREICSLSVIMLWDSPVCLFLNFLTWMLMTAVCRSLRGCRRTTLNSAHLQKSHHFLLSIGPEIKKKCYWQAIWLCQEERARWNSPSFRWSDSYHLGNNKAVRQKLLLRVFLNIFIQTNTSAKRVKFKTETWESCFLSL